MNTSLTSFALLQKLFSSGGDRTVAYLPVGCTEQHGPILPLATDTIIAEGLTDALCLAMRSHGVKGICYPAVAYSPSRSNGDYPGSTSVDEEVFRSYLEQICESVLHHPFDALVIVCGHGPAEPSLVELAFKINQCQIEQGTKLRPLVVIGITRYVQVFEKRLGRSYGKHADCKEFLLLLKIMGSEFFTDGIMTELESFNRHYAEQSLREMILPGIPMQYRSIQGVIGQPLPDSASDYASLADALWDDLIEAFSDTVNRAFSDLEQL